jgi:hypothetical protein
MFVGEGFLFNFMIGLTVWLVYLFFIALALKAVNKRKKEKMKRILKMQQDAENERFKMRIDAENFERVGRYEEAAELYDASGEPESAIRCRMLSDYLTIFNE